MWLFVIKYFFPGAFMQLEYKKTKGHVFPLSCLNRKGGKGMKASITLEASIVLPIFLFLFLNLVTVMEIYRSHALVSTSLWKSGRNLAMYTYLYRQAVPQGDDDWQEVLDMAAGIAASEGYVRSVIVDDMRHVDGPSQMTGLSDGRFSLFKSGIEKGDIIHLQVTYGVLPLVRAYPGLISVQKACFYGHAFTGYDITHQGSVDGDPDVEYVYITPQGSVYHKNPNCTYLKPKVTEVEVKSLPGMKNASGEGYKNPCRFCHGSGDGRSYYITEYGDVYHTKPDCNAIHHDIIRVSILDVGGKGPCSKCGV